MKTKSFTIVQAILIGLIAGVAMYKAYFEKNSTAKPIDQLRLEEILSIKELHLVKHSYTDLFLIHRKNNSDKPVRALVQVPVSVTAYLNLENLKIVKDRDTVRSVILPEAILHEPAYELDKMHITRLRAFQLRAGSDMYADVSQYLQEVIGSRIDSVSNVAIKNHILEQAEAEGKEYIETLLKAVGRPDIIVTFGDTAKDKRIAAVQHSYIIEKKAIRVAMRINTIPTGSVIRRGLKKSLKTATLSIIPADWRRLKSQINAETKREQNLRKSASTQSAQVCGKKSILPFLRTSRFSAHACHPYQFAWRQTNRHPGVRQLATVQTS